MLSPPRPPLRRDCGRPVQRWREPAGARNKENIHLISLPPRLGPLNLVVRGGPTARIIFPVAGVGR